MEKNLIDEYIVRGIILIGEGSSLLFLPGILAYGRRVTFLEGLRQESEVSELWGKKIDSNCHI